MNNMPRKTQRLTDAPEDIRRANRMMYAESLLALAIGLAIRLAVCRFM